MRSLSTKLILAFLGIGIVSVSVIFLTARWNTRLEFIRFVSDQNEAVIVTDLVNYHRQYGSWQGVEALFLKEGHPGMGMGRGPHMDMMQPYLLADPNGYVIVPNGKYQTGEKLPPEQLEIGILLTENGTPIGFLIPLGGAFEGTPRELEFIERTNRTLIYGALLSGVIALFLGIFLSRTVTRPIRELTRATQAISQGDLSQQVPVRTNDELGELARAFNKMSAELSRSINARKQMTADIAHELRTPLSLILGHAEAVHDGVLPPSKENFEIIREEAVRLEHLVEDLRTLSLADAGELSILPQPIEPERLLREVASLFQYQAQKKHISLELDLAWPLPTLEVDPGRMTQVLTNILDNALRHTPEGGRILLSAKQAGGRVELAVQDSGPGLPPEEAERIFERFYRTDASRRRDEGGSGLGLAIAKSIVQAHDGQIWAETANAAANETSKGLKIVISLPYHVAAGSKK